MQPELLGLRCDEGRRSEQMRLGRNRTSLARGVLTGTRPQAWCCQARQSCTTGAARLPMQARILMECRRWFAPEGTRRCPTGCGSCTERPSFREKSSRISASANVGQPDVVPYAPSLARRRWRITSGNFQKINVPFQTGPIPRPEASVSAALAFLLFVRNVRFGAQRI